MHSHPLPSVQLEPLTNRHEAELIAAARAVAADLQTAHRLWWARSDYSLADARAFIGQAAMDRSTGHGNAFAVRDGQGQFIGCVSAKHMDRLHGCFQGGYWLVPAGRGRGQGQASLKALFAWAVEQGMVRMELHIGVDNHVSQAVALRIGAHHEGVMRSRFLLNNQRIDVNLMALLAT